MLGERLVECAVEVGDALDTGEFLATCPDDFQSREIVPGDWLVNEILRLSLFSLIPTMAPNPQSPSNGEMSPH